MKCFCQLLAGLLRSIGMALVAAWLVETGLCQDRPLQIRIDADGNNIQLSWAGQKGSYQLQKLAGFGTGRWENIGRLITAATATIPRTEIRAFFRVRSFPGSNFTVFDGGTLDDLRSIQPALSMFEEEAPQASSLEPRTVPAAASSASAPLTRSLGCLQKRP